MISELSKAGLSAAVAALAIGLYAVDQAYVPAEVDASRPTIRVVQTAGNVAIEATPHRTTSSSPANYADGTCGSGSFQLKPVVWSDWHER